jgi:hypothetical protein
MEGLPVSNEGFELQVNREDAPGKLAHGVVLFGLGAFLIVAPMISPVVVGLEIPVWLQPVYATAFLGGIGLIGLGLDHIKKCVVMMDDGHRDMPVQRKEPEIPRLTLEAAPKALSDMSSSDDLRHAVERFDATKSAWLKATCDDMGGDRPRLEHGIRVVQQACVDTIENPALVKSEDAHMRIVGTMERLTAELDRQLEDREQGDLANLELDLSTLERQLSLLDAKVA